MNYHTKQITHINSPLFPTSVSTVYVNAKNNVCNCRSIEQQTLETIFRPAPIPGSVCCCYPVDFWTGLLGFDLPKLYPTFELVFNDLINWRGSTATDMEHHFDEAFGYFGVPIDFPTNTDNVVFWGDYCNDRNVVLTDINKTIMDGFLKGRAAISGKDLIARDEAIETVRNGWELVIATTALHYLNSGLNNLTDDALRGHALSEAIGFIYSLQFSPTKSITNSQIEELLTLIGGTSDILNSDLYNVSSIPFIY